MGTLNIQGVVDSRHCHIYSTLFFGVEGDLWEHSIPGRINLSYIFTNDDSFPHQTPCLPNLVPRQSPLSSHWLPSPSLSLSIQLFGINRLACAQRRDFSLEVGHSQLSNSIFSAQGKNEVVKVSRYEAILPVFQGNMLYFVLVVVEEYLDL